MDDECAEPIVALGMQLRTVNAAGEPVGEWVSFPGPAVVEMGSEPVLPKPVISSMTGVWSFPITHSAFLALLEWLSGPQAVADYLQDVAAIAQWESDGGWCG